MDGASVYIVRCNDGSFYVGITQRSVEERVSEHNSGLIPGYTSHRRPVELLFSECYARIDDAIAAEKRIKGWSRAKKVAYMRGDFDAHQRFARGPRRGAFFDSSALHSAQNDGDGGAASTGKRGVNFGPSSSPSD